MNRLQTIRVGDPLPEHHHTPTELDLFFYNAAIWNGHRIHYDEAWATKKEGYPGLVVQGPLQGDWLGQCVTEWLGAEGSLIELEYSNRGAAYAGQTLTSGGRVTSVDPANGEVAVELFVRNEEGEILCPGSALVRIG